MSKIFPFFPPVIISGVGGGFFMKSILNKSYHRSRAFWSCFVTRGCGCVFNFLSIKSKYTPVFHTPHCEIQTRGVNMSRQVRNIHFYLPAVFSFLMLMMGFNRQPCACMPPCFLSNTTPPKRQGGGGRQTREERGEKSSLPACLVRSWMGSTNKHQTSWTQLKLFFFIKWLLIHVSRRYARFDRSKIATKTQLFTSSLLVWLLVCVDLEAELLLYVDPRCLSAEGRKNGGFCGVINRPRL